MKLTAQEAARRWVAWRLHDEAAFYAGIFSAFEAADDAQKAALELAFPAEVAAYRDAVQSVGSGADLLQSL